MSVISIIIIINISSCVSSINIICIYIYIYIYTYVYVLRYFSIVYYSVAYDMCCRAALGKLQVVPPEVMLDDIYYVYIHMLI